MSECPVHAPLPWHLDDGVVAADGQVVCGDVWKADARLIVRAVNSHAALIAAAKYTVAVLDGKKPKDFEPDQPFDLVTLKSAIAAAEELAP